MDLNMDITDENYIKLALKEAAKAYDAGEVPVGALVVHGNQVIGRGYNQRERLNDPTAHAEMIAITAAANWLGDWRLQQCTLYVTKEPCPMCAGAIVNSRIERIVFGAWDEEAGCCGSLYQLCRDPRFKHQAEVVGGIMEHDCTAILQEFFQRQRDKGH